MNFIINTSSLFFIFAIFMTELLISTGSLFYIVESLDNSCPGEFEGVPCLTLQQYVSNPSIDENVTLLFEMGSHHLSSSFSITQSMAYTWSGSSSNVEIICSSAARISFSSISKVHIRGIIFTQCNLGVSFAAITTLTLDSCVFQNARAAVNYGPDERNPPLSLANVASGYIKNSQFINNTNSYSHGSGGVIYVSGSLLHINDSTFARNSARRFGGAIYATVLTGSDYDMQLLIHNSTFSHNSVANRFYTHGGGAIFVTNGYRRLSSAVLSSSTFLNNFAGAYGGGIYYRGSEDLVIRSSRFLNNTGSSYGGGALYSESKVYVIRSNFSKNIAYVGGAISVNNASTITDCVFFNNTAATYGGALHSNGTNSSILVSRSNFIHNTARSHGGAAIYSNSRYANISLESSTFNYNSASFCGVLDVDEFYHFNVSISDSSFQQNEASAQNNAIGGGVACIRNASLSISRSNFSYNRGSHHGGVFYIDESYVSVMESLFVYNHATLDGGVFYTNVHASNYDVQSSQFSYNSAGDDGGVFYIGRRGSQVSVENSLFTFNTAVDQGGVVAAAASSYLQMNSSNVVNNSASYGDVISACNVAMVTVDENLTLYSDSQQPLCSLYNGTITGFNITAKTDYILPPNKPITPPTSTPPVRSTLPSTDFKHLPNHSSSTSLTSMASYNPTVKPQGTTKSTNETEGSSTNFLETTSSSFNQETELKLYVLIGIIAVLLLVNIFIITCITVTFVKKQQKCRRKSTHNDTEDFYNSQNPAYGTHTLRTIETELIKIQ